LNKLKTNLVVFSFPLQKTRIEKELKKETKKLQYVAISETPIYNYIQNISKHVHISFFLL